MNINKRCRALEQNAKSDIIFDFEKRVTLLFISMFFEKWRKCRNNFFLSIGHLILFQKFLLLLQLLFAYFLFVLQSILQSLF